MSSHVVHPDPATCDLIADAEAATGERIAQALEARNIKWHGHDCLCLVCDAFREAAKIARGGGHE